MTARKISALCALAWLSVVSSGLAAEIQGGVSPKKSYSLVCHPVSGEKGEEFSIKDNKSSRDLGMIYKDRHELGLVPAGLTAKWSKDETKLLIVVEFLKTSEVICVERKGDGKFAVVECAGLPRTGRIADVNTGDFEVKDAEGYRFDGAGWLAGNWDESGILVYEYLGLINAETKQRSFGMSFLIKPTDKGFAVSKVVKWGEVSKEREKEILGKLKIR